MDDAEACRARETGIVKGAGLISSSGADRLEFPCAGDGRAPALTGMGHSEPLRTRNAGILERAGLATALAADRRALHGAGLRPRRIGLNSCRTGRECDDANGDNHPDNRQEFRQCSHSSLPSKPLGAASQYQSDDCRKDGPTQKPGNASPDQHRWGQATGSSHRRVCRCFDVADEAGQPRHEACKPSHYQAANRAADTADPSTRTRSPLPPPPCDAARCSADRLYGVQDEEFSFGHRCVLIDRCLSRSKICCSRSCPDGAGQRIPQCLLLAFVQRRLENRSPELADVLQDLVGRHRLCKDEQCGVARLQAR